MQNPTQRDERFLRAALVEAVQASEQTQLPLALGSGSPELSPGQLYVLAEIEALDPLSTTPMDALLALQRLQERLKGDS